MPTEIYKLEQQLAAAKKAKEDVARQEFLAKCEKWLGTYWAFSYGSSLRDCPAVECGLLKLSAQSNWKARIWNTRGYPTLEVSQTVVGARNATKGKYSYSGVGLTVRLEQRTFGTPGWEDDLQKLVTRQVTKKEFDLLHSRVLNLAQAAHEQMVAEYGGQTLDESREWVTTRPHEPSHLHTLDCPHIEVTAPEANKLGGEYNPFVLKSGHYLLTPHSIELARQKLGLDAESDGRVSGLSCLSDADWRHLEVASQTRGTLEAKLMEGILKWGVTR